MSHEDVLIVGLGNGRERQMLEQGEVEAFKHSGEGYPAWWDLKLKDRKEFFTVHNNWVIEFGELKLGDRIRFEIAKVGTYSDGATYLKKLERIEEKSTDTSVEE